MSDDLQPLALLAWRIQQLESIEAAMRQEIFELRQAQGSFVTRKEIREASLERRQWPVIVASVAVAAASVSSLIIQLAGH